MKQLTCEMCGSTELLKQDGIFVCQTCGTKYTVEEAKKMMVEGTVDVTGSTVNVDRRNEIENRLENIKNEFNNGNNDNVKQMCIELLNIDPNNYQAIIYSALAEGWKSTIAKPQLIKASNELQRAVKVIRESYEDDETYTKLCIELMCKMQRLAKAMIDLYVKHEKEQQSEVNRWMREYNDGKIEIIKYIGSSAYSRAAQRVDGYRQRAVKIDNDRVNTYNNGCASVCKAVNNLAIEIINQIKNKANVCAGFYDEFEKYVNVCKGYLTTKEVKNQHDSIMQFLPIARKEIQAKRNETYWREHSEEKAQLEAELSSIEPQLENANQQLTTIEGENGSVFKQLQKDRCSSVPSENDKQACEKRISDMKAEYKALGLFNGKEKKALRERIDNEKNQLGEIEERIKKEKQELSAQIDSRIEEINTESKPIRQKITELTRQKQEVKAELTKDR